MSSSLNLENELNQMAEKLNDESFTLRDAAEVLKNIREKEEIRNQEIDSLKNRVNNWLTKK